MCLTAQFFSEPILNHIGLLTFLKLFLFPLTLLLPFLNISQRQHSVELNAGVGQSNSL